MHELILTTLCTLYGAIAFVVAALLIRMHLPDLRAALDRRAKRRAQSLQITRRLRGLRLDHQHRR